MDASENRQALPGEKIQKCIEALQNNELDNCHLLLKDLCDKVCNANVLINQG